LPGTVGLCIAVFLFNSPRGPATSGTTGAGALGLSVQLFVGGVLHFGAAEIIKLLKSIECNIQVARGNDEGAG
jgi:hypothetical protein